MKTKFFLLCMAAFTIALTSAAQKTKTYLPQDKIPAKIKTYVTRHFPDQNIVYAEKEQKHSKTEYEIKLDNMTELEFNKGMDVKEIKGKSGLPDSAIPPKVLSYVKAQYPDNAIVQWEMKKNKQEVELDNDLELEFNHSGEFLRIDD